MQGYEPANGPVRRDLQSLIIRFNRGETFKEEWLAQLEEPEVVKEIIATPVELLGIQLAHRLGWFGLPESIGQRTLEEMIAAISNVLDRACNGTQDDYELLLWVQASFSHLERLLDKFDNALLSDETLMDLGAIWVRKNVLEQRFSNWNWDFPSVT